VFLSVQSNLSIRLWLDSLLLDLARFSFQILDPIYTVGTTPWTTQTQNKPKQTYMPSVGFEPTIPALERAKTLHASDRAATVIGRKKASFQNNEWITENGKHLNFLTYLIINLSYIENTV
jgi:hypothetical protein